MKRRLMDAEKTVAERLSDEIERLKGDNLRLFNELELARKRLENAYRRNKQSDGGAVTLAAKYAKMTGKTYSKRFATPAEWERMMLDIKKIAKALIDVSDQKAG